MVTRELQVKLALLATKFPFVTITGPRQSGKSTLARMAFPDYRHVSLEDLGHPLEYVAGDIEYRCLSINALTHRML